MRRGFTILELLVASLLLASLMAILSMLFNQSSISWNTGTAGVASLDKVRNNMASLRDDADNAYIWKDEIHRVVSVWDDNGNLRTRAWDVPGSGTESSHSAEFLKAKANLSNNATIEEVATRVSVGDASGGRSVKTYIVNVKSAGPNREHNDFDDIWSFPDEIQP